MKKQILLILKVMPFLCISINSLAQNDSKKEILLNKTLWTSSYGSVYLSSLYQVKDSLILNFLITSNSNNSEIDFILYRAIFDGMKDANYMGITKNKKIGIPIGGDKRFSVSIPNSISFVFFDGAITNESTNHKVLIKVKTQESPDFLTKEESENKEIIDISSLVK